MADNIKRIIKDNYIIPLCSVIVFAVMLLFLIIHHIEPFGDNSLIRYDCLHQYYPFLSVLYDKLKNGESLYYYWNSGLGTNYLLNYVYNLTCPLNFLVIFVKREHITVFITFLIIFKLSLSAGTFSFYISSKKIEKHNKLMNIVLSVAYGLSNFAICYSHELMWLDAYILLPIIIYGFERMMVDKKTYIYIVSLSLCAYCNIYPTIFVAIFLILLFIFFEHNSLKNFFFDGLRFAFTSILAAGMTAFTLIITILNLSITYVGTDTFESHYWYGNIFEVIRYQFIFSKPVTISNDFNRANLYCGTFSIILIFIFAFIKEINIFKKIKSIGFLILLLVSMNESVLNYIWHGFHVQTGVPNRFAFGFVFIILSLSYEASCYINKNNIRGILIGSIIAEIYPMICYFFTDFASYIVSKNILLLTLGFVLIYSILFIIVSFVTKQRTIIFIFLSLVMFLEIVLNADYIISKYASEGKDTYSVSKIYDIMENINKTDKQMFYRSEVSSQSANLNACYGVNGLGVFSSWYPYESYMSLFNLGVSATSNQIKSISYTEPIEDMFGINYIIDIDGNKVNNEKHNYKRVFEEDDISIYKNNNAVPLLYASEDSIKNVSLDERDTVFSNINSVLYGISYSNQVLEEFIPEYELSAENCEIKTYESNNLELQYTTDNPQSRKINMEFLIPEDGEFIFYFGNDGSRYELDIFVNDEYFNGINNDACVSLNLGNRKKNDKIGILIQGIEAEKEFSLQNESGLYGLIFARINYESLKKYVEYATNNSMNIEELKDGYIRGNIKLNSNQVLFSSIPYDDCWRIYDNGKVVNIDNYVGFIGLDLGEGNHQLEFKYVPRGVKSGFCFTLLSWIIFVCYIIVNVKLKNNCNIVRNYSGEDDGEVRINTKEEDNKG